MRWVDAGNALFDIIGDRPDLSVVDADECRAWLQNSAYEGYLTRVEVGWVGHRRGVIVHRWAANDTNNTRNTQSGSTRRRDAARCWRSVQRSTLAAHAGQSGR